jgi:hypothetical protein
MNPRVSLSICMPAESDHISNQIPLDWYNENGKPLRHDQGGFRLANLEWTFQHLSNNPTILEERIVLPRNLYLPITPPATSLSFPVEVNHHPLDQ